MNIWCDFGNNASENVTLNKKVVSLHKAIAYPLVSLPKP